MPTPTALDRAGLVSLADLDGTHLGIATGLLRAEIAGDTQMRTLAAQVTKPREAFTSCLELLLAQAALTAEKIREKTGLCLHPISTFALLDLCLLAARRIESEHGIRPIAQADLYAGLALLQSADPDPQP